MTRPFIQRTLLTLAIVAGLTGLSACGKKDEPKVATQVAAKVGSEEISVHQINQVLSRTNTNGATPETVKAMSREVLEKLIDQQLAVDQATEAKLNRSPEVVAQIEAAKRDILARAYIQSLTGALAKPSPEDVKKYYTEHPQLFAERRVFNVQEIVAPVAPGVADALRAAAASNKPIEQIAADLKAKDIKFNGGGATRAAEQIPLEILPKVHALKDGQTIVIETPQTITLLHLVASQNAPVAEAAALPRIEQFLANQRAGEAVSARLKALRTSTTVTYMGDFSGTEQKAPVAPVVKSGTAIENGVAGLK
jgi:EpsD family peptidyl-prolyl cis-trans isomerase